MPAKKAATAKEKTVKEKTLKETVPEKTVKEKTAKPKTVRRKKAVQPEPATPTQTEAEAAASVPEQADAAVIANAAPAAPELPQPRRSVAFIGSECYPFVKTGGLGDVMYALPKALVALNCDVRVILPRYKCIPWKYQEKMVYRGAFDMDLCEDGRKYYVGIMEYVWDGVVYDFIDNEEFFSFGNPYTNLIDAIPKYCCFGKAALAALNFMD